MTWLLLFVAIVAEVIGTSLLKSTEGFTRLWPTVASLAAYVIALLVLSRVIARGMNVGVAYAVWSGLGTTLIVVISALFLGQSVTVLKVLGIAAVIVGVVTLNLGGAH